MAIEIFLEPRDRYIRIEDPRHEISCVSTVCEEQPTAIPDTSWALIIRVTGATRAHITEMLGIDGNCHIRQEGDDLVIQADVSGPKPQCAITTASLFRNGEWDLIPQRRRVTELCLQDQVRLEASPEHLPPQHCATPDQSSCPRS